MTKRQGWASTFPEFRDTTPAAICGSLADFLRDVDEGQLRAWQSDVPHLQREVTEIIEREPGARAYHAVLEYELPFETRRTDVLLLASGLVVVLELKGKAKASRADVDQAAAYGRDLRCYHRACHTRDVRVVVVPMRAAGLLGEHDGVVIAGPEAVDALVARWDRPGDAAPVPIDDFLDEDAYQPLPSIVSAARELFQSEGKLRYIQRARAATESTLNAIAHIARDAASTRTRHLVVVTGAPGTGKTLVGLQLVHARFLDGLSIERARGKPTAPAVFLSGNGPLVNVLRYQLREAGGDGKAFVRGVKDYLDRFITPGKVPTEHVLVFDEAQRAWDAGMMAKKHKQLDARSEPEHFIELASRVPEWCVVVALVGTGQEIHEGEEAGLAEWRRAYERSGADWHAHVPPGVAGVFNGLGDHCSVTAELNLEVEVRFHAANELHVLVERFLADGPLADARDISDRLARANYHLRVTRDLDAARTYMRERYINNQDARFGLLASSRDQDLERFGVDNGFRAQQRVAGRVGAWFTDAEGAPGHHSCRYLRTCATEFHAQGLELDGVVLAWGTDFMWDRGGWSNRRARQYRASRVRDPKSLRRNAYRVLLTRAREVSVAYVPQLEELNDTYDRLTRAGFQEL